MHMYRVTFSHRQLPTLISFHPKTAIPRFLPSFSTKFIPTKLVRIFYSRLFFFFFHFSFLTHARLRTGQFFISNLNSSRILPPNQTLLKICLGKFYPAKFVPCINAEIRMIKKENLFQQLDAEEIA